MKIRNLFIVFCMVILCGCSEIGPAAFWTGFDDPHIVKNISDQGPWGGYRLMYWRNNERPYTAKEVVVFATLHKWDHFKTDTLNNEETNNWVADHADSLCLHHPSHYPGSRGKGISLTFLDSNWSSIQNDTTKAALGYVLISSDGKQLVVYHTWGE